MTETRTLTDFEYTLLGLLARSPMSGYDLKKAFVASPLSRYAPSSGNLYPALHRLESDGNVTASIEHKDEVRGKRVFTPTVEGLLALDVWLHQPLDRETVTQRIEFVMMRFALMEGRSQPEQVITFLEKLRDILAGYLAELELYITATETTGSLHQRLSVRHGATVVRARLLWAQEAIEAVRSDSLGPMLEEPG